MINSKTSWLFVLLGLQMTLTLIIFAYKESTTESLDAKPLITTEAQVIDELVISDKAGELRLNKTEGGWVIPALGGLAANEIKLTTVLSDLLNLKSDWPVASATGSRSRFEVSEDNFIRRVDLLSSNANVGRIYVGTSPGFKKSHVRLDGQKNIYSLALNTYDLPTEPADWLDKSLISVQNISSIEGLDFKLVSTNGEWSLISTEKELASDSIVKVNEENANALDMALKTLTVLSVADKDVNLGDSKSSLLEVYAPNQITFTFFEKEDKYYVSRSGIDKIFTLSKFNFDKLSNQNLISLSEPDTEKTPVTPAGQSSSD